MLNRDIYQNIALYADFETIKNMIICGDEFVESIDNNLFWEKKFRYDNFPPVSPTVKTLQNWLTEYENVVDIKNRIATFTDKLKICKYIRIYISDIDFVRLRMILTNNTYKVEIYDTIYNYISTNPKAPRIFSIFIGSNTGCDNALLYGFFYKHNDGTIPSYTSDKIQIFHQDVMQILFLALYMDLDLQAISQGKEIQL